MAVNRQQVPILKKIVVTEYMLGRTKENGEDGLVFLTPLGEAYVFPTPDELKTEIIKLLTGGIEVPKVVLPGQG